MKISWEEQCLILEGRKHKNEPIYQKFICKKCGKIYDSDFRIVVRGNKCICGGELEEKWLPKSEWEKLKRGDFSWRKKF